MKIKINLTRQENADYFGVDVGDTVEIDFEEYVAAVVASEIGNSSIEACKAQAVASRTFALRYIDKVISDSSAKAQAYRADRYDESKYGNCIAAAQATAGQVLFYNGKLITAVFSSNNGGRTVSSKSRWGTSYSYLIEQKDPWDNSKKKTGHGVGMSQNGIKNAAALGVGYKEMLEFYYPRADLVENYGQEKIVKVPRFLLEELERILKELEKLAGNAE